MLYIIAKERSYSWHTGEVVPVVNIDNVVRVQADGDELTFIERRFKNLPITNNRVVVWHGDLAKFIYDNLCCC